MKTKKNLVSGITISGSLTIAHYLIIIKQLHKLQNNYELFLFIADFHAITTTHDVVNLNRLRFQTASQYLACGISPALIFLQSEIPGHTELSFLFGCHMPLGELHRMTQFKNKKQDADSSFALLNYPLLMAADILLYDADVLVGPDQKQHVELTRNLVQRLNRKFGACFRMPELIENNLNRYRIRNLQNPKIKMSKSAKTPEGILFLNDTPATIRQKLKRCVTDSDNEIRFDFLHKPGVSNLILLYALCKDLSPDKAALLLQKQCQNYLELKQIVGETIIELLVPIQRKIADYSAQPAIVWKHLAQGNLRARKVSAAKMRFLRDKIGFPFLRFED